MGVSSPVKVIDLSSSDVGFIHNVFFDVMQHINILIIFFLLPELHAISIIVFPAVKSLQGVIWYSSFVVVIYLQFTRNEYKREDRKMLGVLQYPSRYLSF